MRDMSLARTLWDQRLDGFAQQLTRFVTEQGQGLPINGRNHTVAIRDHDGVRRRFQQQQIVRLAAEWRPIELCGAFLESATQ